VQIVTCVALALIFASCDKGRSDPPPAVIEQSPVDGVELLSTGSEPTRLLRYRLAKGATSPLELAMDLDIDAGGRAGKIPTLILSLTIAIEDVLADGNARIKTTVEKARVQEREGSTVPIAAMSNMAEALTGMTYTATLSADGKLSGGRVTSSHAQTMAKEISQFTEGLEQIAMRLPTLPVGIGAKWSNRKTTTQNGVTLTTVTTVSLTAIDGDKMSFTSTSTVSAPDQTVQQGAMKASIRDIGGGGSGKGLVDLSKMTMIGELEVEFRGKTSDQGSASNLRAAMKIRMK
jgi:hypothetical protein